LNISKKLAPLVFCLAAVATSAWPQQASPWIDVPFVKQPTEGCGAASVAMVMQYWQGREGKIRSGSEVATIQRALYSQQAHGIYASDLERYLNEQDFETHVFRGDPALLQQQIEKGRPTIVALKPGRGSQLHYVVVAGVDPLNRLMIVNDPAQRKLLKVESHQFEKEWQATGNWTLLAVPKSDSH
jgi:ABC-type bacteriocin/lantibiotic exporter with double-glycine peptidase domain